MGVVEYQIKGIFITYKKWCQLPLPVAPGIKKNPSFACNVVGVRAGPKSMFIRK